MIRQFGLLCIVVLLFILTWTVIVPREHQEEILRQNQADREQPQEHGQTRSRKVTFKEVSKKSQDAFKTTTAYMKQEKESLQRKMSITLQHVERELARLHAEAERAQAADKSNLNRQIMDLQEARVNLLNLQADLHQPKDSMKETLKSNWNRLEMDINSRIRSIHSS